MPHSYLHVVNIPETCNWNMLQSIFGEFGKISKIYLHPAREFAKVIYDSTESINKAYRFVNDTHPQGLSAMIYTSQTKSSVNATDLDSSLDSDLSSLPVNNSKKPNVNDVDTLVNRNYVDVFGRVVTTLRDDNGDLYIALKELKKSGFELFQVGSLPARNSGRVYDPLKLSQFELYMKTKAAKFMSTFNFNVSEDKLNDIIDCEKRDYLNMEQQGSTNNISSLKRKTVNTTKCSLKNENTIKNNSENFPHALSKKNVINKSIQDEGMVNKSSKTNVQNNNTEFNGDNKVNYNDANTSLRRPLSTDANTPATKPLSRVSLELHKFHEVNVVNVESDIAWVQLISNMSIIENIMLEVMKECKTAPSIKPTLNLICAALFDDVWYRAIVLNISPLKVQYIDYGNKNTAVLEKVLKISDKLSSIAAQAVPISFVSDPNIQVERKTTLCVNPKNQNEDGSYMVRINERKMFHSTPIASPVDKQTENNSCEVIASPKPTEIPSKQLFSRPLSIETVSTNGVFEFAQRINESVFTAFGLPNDLTKEVCTLEEISNDCKPDLAFKPNVGDLVAAKTSQGFVRATIINCLNDQYKCALIDFGTTETTNVVCLLPEKYLSLPEFSFECKLDSDAIESIQNCKSGALAIKSPCCVSFQLKPDQEYEVMGHRWNPLATRSVSSNNASKPSKTNENELKLRPAKQIIQRKIVIEEVSNASLFDFVEATGDTTFTAFACPESFSEEIGVLEGINDDTNFNASFIPKEGDLVAAKTPDGFVRGLVLDASNEYKCALIDYGTTKLVSEVRCLPDKYKSIPEFAFECETTPKVIQDLKAHKCTSCSISSPNIVTITLDNGNEYQIKGHRWNPLKINSKPSQKPIEKLDSSLNKSTFKRKVVIEDICDNGIFEYVKGVDKNHFIAFALPDLYAEDLCLLEGLSDDCKYDPHFTPKVDDFIALKTTESFARGLILRIQNGEYTCALLDYGTIETSNKVYQLPSKYVKIPEFAFICKIENGSVDDFQDSKCVSFQIKSPKVLNVTLESGKSYVLHGSHWNPGQNSYKPVETNNVKNGEVSTSKSNSIGSLPTERKLVIDDVCESGVFELVESITDTTFVGFAFPCTFIKEVSKLNEIDKECTPDPLFKPNIGDLVAAPHNNELVRASVINDLKGQYKCGFIDYGCVEIVDIVCPLPDVYKSIPEFCFEGHTDKETLKILKTTPCKSLKIKSPRVLTLTLESGKVFEVKGYRWNPLNLKTVQRKTPVLPPEKPKQALFKGEPSGVVLKDSEQVLIVTVLDEFLIVRNKQCNSLFKTVQQELVDYKGDSFLETPQVGYLAVYLKDDNSCRVLVTDMNGSAAKIEYVDYGESAVVPVKQLTTINKKLASMENTIMKIRLKGFVESRFTPKMLEVLKQISEKKEKFVLEKVAGETNVYELIGGDKIALSTKLQNLTKPLRTATPENSKRDKILKAISLKKKSVCTLNDITRHNIEVGSNEFLCLFTSYLNEGNISFCKADEETVELLNEVTSAISKHIDTDNVSYQPELLEVCLAKFEDEWYRAAVVKINENKSFNVFFVDYGNSHIVTMNEIRKLPEELAKIRGLAILCTLEGVCKENEEEVNEPLLSRLREDIVENQIYTVNVIACENKAYKITIPSLLKNWKKDRLL